MDPEKFRLTTEGISGESKGMVIGESGTVSVKKEYWSEIGSADQFWWKIRAYLSTVCYLTILNPDFFPFQTCELFTDAIHDLLLAPTSGGGRLPVAQAKVAWKTMIAAMHVRVHQTKCTLASLTDNEMFWKHHWAWHAGARGAAALEDSPSGATPPTPAERRLQSQLDKLQNQQKRWGNGKGDGRKRSRGNRSGNKGDGGKQTGGGANFNKNIPPAPGQQGYVAGKKTTGGQAFANRKKHKGGGK